MDREIENSLIFLLIKNLLLPGQQLADLVLVELEHNVPVVLADLAVIHIHDDVRDLLALDFDILDSPRERTEELVLAVGIVGNVVVQTSEIFVRQINAAQTSVRRIALDRGSRCLVVDSILTGTNTRPDAVVDLVRQPLKTLDIFGGQHLLASHLFGSFATQTSQRALHENLSLLLWSKLTSLLDGTRVNRRTKVRELGVSGPLGLRLATDEGPILLGLAIVTSARRPGHDQLTGLGMDGEQERGLKGQIKPSERLEALVGENGSENRRQKCGLHGLLCLE